MSEPVVARPKPCLINVKAGRTYFWCSCGRSAKQPFCDGSHRGTGFEPRPYTAGPQDEELLFCGCKHTRNAPFCDGAHTNLPGGSPLDDPASAANRQIPVVTKRDGARALLNGSCYVFSSGLATMETRGALRYCYMVSPEMGSQYQTQIFMDVAGAPSPIMTLGAREVILFVGSGSGSVTISGRSLRIKATDGIYIRPSEAFQIAADGGQMLKIFVLACPQAQLGWLEDMPDNFDARHPERVVAVDAAQRTAMGPRYFQILVDKRIGSNVITQFIGHIPPSKAAPHRHLYEEAIIVLNGEGYMWTEDRKARVAAGDVIFLPRKQLHSLEATSADGIDVVGVICPGDNPSINYYD
ncbi:MAG TPA: CDGSH iron-sulfur domain-containing protein [Steroidobacteraceae bacterium]|nr:CDGSH iron-sulfur domain-containing protein [Steroidobacteraceae bacterium]